MENLEEKLSTYRLRKRRQEKFDTVKTKLKKFFMLGVGNKNEDSIKLLIDEDSPDVSPTDTPVTPVKQNRKLFQNFMQSPVNSTSSTSSEHEISDAENEIIADTPAANESRLFKYITRTIFVLFWITLYIIAIELKFGIVFLMISALVAICLNTRTTPRKPNEISAYSVFNDNCESIDGTLKAEQFEREIRFGSGSVR